MNVYEMVTERIIEQLESGVIPWQKPWTGSKNGAKSEIVSFWKIQLIEEEEDDGTKVKILFFYWGIPNLSLPPAPLPMVGGTNWILDE